MNKLIILYALAISSLLIMGGCQTPSNVVVVPVNEVAITDDTTEVETTEQDDSPTEPDKPVVDEELFKQKTVYFTRNSSVLSDNAQATLRSLSSEILKNIEFIQGIDVTGHVAFAGTEAGRAEISRDRATVVAQYLTGLGVEQSLIKTMSLGATQPAATNSTEEGRALNRRANIQVIQKQ